MVISYNNDKQVIFLDNDHLASGDQSFEEKLKSIVDCFDRYN